jgi:hypothetical protein
MARAVATARGYSLGNYMRDAEDNVKRLINEMILDNKGVILDNKWVILDNK